MINQRICRQADELEAAEKFEKAIETLNQIPDYAGVTEHIAALEEKIRVRDYSAAAALEEAGKFEEAIAAFTAMGDYSDSRERIGVIEEKIRMRDYNAAAALEEAGKFEEAIASFTAMGGYSDSEDRIKAIGEKILERDYNAAAALEEAGNYAEAYSAFLALGDYRDSVNRAVAVTEKAEEQKRQEAYTAAAEAESKGNLETAAAGFEALGEYQDAPARLENVRVMIRSRDYDAAMKALNAEQYEQAEAGFTALGDYRDSRELLVQAQTGKKYQTAVKDALAGNLKAAYDQFVALGDYKDSAKKAEICGNLSRTSKTQEITEGVLIYEFHELWGIANMNTNVITAAKYTRIMYNPDSNYVKYNLLQVFLDGAERDNSEDTYGYIDHNGQEIIPCKYIQITDFTEDGYCSVARYAKEKEGWNTYGCRCKYGIMDYTGKTITQAQWRTMGKSENTYWDRSYSIYDSYYCKINKPEFVEGRMMVQNPAGLWGFIDESGRILGEVKWSSIGNFSDGMAMVAQSSSVKSGYSTKTITKYGFIDKQGNQIGEVRWDAVNAFSNGLAAVKENGYWGFINKQNELVIPCRYTEVNAFKEDGTCDVKTKDGTWQIINTKGEVSFF